jgi:ribosomal protein S18 acetylase RimI-like enzyme
VRIGETVSLRVQTPAGPADLVGTLVAAGPESLRLRRRDGSIVEVRVDDVRAGRVVPPGPAARVSVPDLERVASLGWRPLETAALGDWQLRASDGFTRRGNSALAVGDAGVELSVAVGAVQAWYAERGLPARIQLTDQDAPAALGALLDDADWSADGETSMLTADLGPVLRTPTVDLPVVVDETPDEAWLAAYRQMQWQRAAGGLPAAAVGLLRNHDLAGFASVRIDGEVAGIARVAVDGRWAGLSAVAVADDRRRQGLARAVSVGALRWATGQRARRAYLQVEVGNGAARALYDGLGFARHHGYGYRTAPP